MMNRTNNDDTTKEIISGSKLELVNPDFNNALMNKIKAENRKRIIVSNLTLYSLMFISIDAVIIVLLNLAGISISDVALNLDLFKQGLARLYSHPEQLISIYFVVLFAASLLIMLFSRTRYPNFKTQER